MTTAVSSPALVGRRPQLAQLQAHLADASGGDPRIVVVSGEAGVGKSRIVADFIDHARKGGAAAGTGGAIDVGGGGLAFGPIVDVLREILTSIPTDEVDALVDPVRDDLARILPELSSSDTSSPLAEEGTAQARLFYGILRVLGGVGTIAPVVIAIEDIHWCDRSTRDVLSY